MDVLLSFFLVGEQLESIFPFEGPFAMELKSFLLGGVLEVQFDHHLPNFGAEVADDCIEGGARHVHLLCLIPVFLPLP